MIVVLAIVLMLVPLAVLYVCERAAKRGRGPLADPARTTVLDGLIVSGPAMATAEVPAMATTDLVFTDSRDTQRCAAESRLVRDLLDGKLDRTRYHAEMAALAGDTASPPVRPPGERPV